MKAILTIQNIGDINFDNGNDVTYKFSVETQEEFISQRSNQLFGMIELSAKITDKNAKNILQIMEWSLDANVGKEQYRTLGLEVTNDHGVERYYEFPQAFVIDYSEEAQGNPQELMFTLKVGQRQLDFNNIKVKELG